jgi:DNA polymerase III delta subunit
VKTALLAECRHAWRRRCPESPLARVLRAAESSVEEILSAYQGTSLFSPRELSIVLEVEDLGRSEKRIAALAAGISRPAGSSCLVLVESAAESPRKSLEPLRAASATRVETPSPGRAELLRWGAARLRRAEISAGTGALEAVVDACEGDALAFFSELEKLCAGTAASGTLGLEETLALLRPVIGADLPEYLGAVALGQPVLAAQRLGRLLAAGIGEGTVLFALANLVGGALGGWARYRELSEALRNRANPRALSLSLDAVYRAESAWKGGRADAVAALEQVTREVCAAA